MLKSYIWWIAIAIVGLESWKKPEKLVAKKKVTEKIHKTDAFQASASHRTS